jgi:hypothetical protein
MASSGIDKAAKALATAGGIAHVAFFTLFAWRVMAGLNPISKVANVIFAALALVGLGAEFVGWSLMKWGGKTKAKRLGYWAIALSTLLAAVLLVVASWSG